MNLGIYISSLGEHDKLQQISGCINENIGTNLLNDASIFYDAIAHNPFTIKCGMFNSTDLWNFNGTLITTSLSTTLSALKIVNKLDIYYYYGFENKINPLSLIYVLKNSNIKLISNSSEADRDLYRKTGVRSVSTCLDFNEIIKTLGAA